MPKVTVEPVAADVTEGAPLTWRISLSEKADTDIVTLARLVPVPGGRPELSTADVDQEWVSRLVDEIPNPAIPLSKVPYETLWITVEPGEKSVDLTVPTVRDQEKEPTEYVRFQFMNDDEDEQPLGAPVEGTVRDAS